jgi:5-oxoprolinase (ATP-hydrolysing)
VAAGGGSICWFDGQKTVVGPQSAGSDPGPACYGKGGPLTVTDVNLYLGKILPEFFAFPLDRSAVEKRLTELCQQIEQAIGIRYSPEELALGFTKIANANMAAAMKKVSIARGYDVRDYVLVSFGGAGAQHACSLARELGVKSILQHPFAGILSAYGIGMANVQRFAQRHVGKPLNDVNLASLEPVFKRMEAELREQVLAEGIPAQRIARSRTTSTTPRPSKNCTGSFTASRSPTARSRSWPPAWKSPERRPSRSSPCTPSDCGSRVRN